MWECVCGCACGGCVGMCMWGVYNLTGRLTVSILAVPVWPCGSHDGHVMVLWLT